MNTLDAFRCNGPGCTRSLRNVSPDEWARLIYENSSRPYLFCSKACAVAYEQHRKKASDMDMDKVFDNILTPDQQKAAFDVANRWLAWIEDPDHKEPPNPKASAERLRAFKASHAGIETKGRALRQTTAGTTAPVDTVLTSPVERAKHQLGLIASERAEDREPNFRDASAHLAWATREQARQGRQRRWEAALRDYLP